MKEIDFKNYLYHNFTIHYTEYSMFDYEICINYNLYVQVAYNEYNDKILPFIHVCYENKEYFYQSFRKALNRILKIMKEGK